MQTPGAVSMCLYENFDWASVFQAVTSVTSSHGKIAAVRRPPLPSASALSSAQVVVKEISLSLEAAIESQAPQSKGKPSLMPRIKTLASGRMAAFYFGSPPCKPHSSLRASD